MANTDQTGNESTAALNLADLTRRKSNPAPANAASRLPLRWPRPRCVLLALLVFSSPAPKADDYSLLDLDGKLHRAAEYRGKWLIINFWATWCMPCLEEMPALEHYYRSNRNRVEVWGVSFEDSARRRIVDYVERLDISYPIHGYGQQSQTGFDDVRVLPTTLVIDPEGELRQRFEGSITAADLRRVIGE